MQLSVGAGESSSSSDAHSQPVTSSSDLCPTGKMMAIDETIADYCLRELAWEDAEVWGLCGSTEQRIRDVYKRGRSLILQTVKTDKSPLKNLKKVSISKSMRDAGKKNLENNLPYDALNLYNKAVIYAPNQEDYLALAISDRASVLVQLGEHELALKDTEIASARGYPFSSQFELEERRAQCYVGMKKFSQARESFEKAISLLDDAAAFLPKKFVERKMNELQSTLNSITYARDEVPEDNSIFLNMSKLPKLHKTNVKYPALSNKVDLSPGQSVLASAHIEVGEIIGVEEPVVSAVEKDFAKTNCWHCLVTMKAPLACPLCSGVKFCSRECLQTALSTYHPSECLLTDLLTHNSNGYSHLAYRMVASRSLHQVLACRHKIQPPNGTNSLAGPSDLSGVFQLPTHHTEWPLDEVKRRTIMVVFYLILLQMTGYFDKNEENGRVNPSLSSIYQMKGKENDTSLSEEELSVAMIIDHLIEAAAFSTTEVCHFELGAGQDWTRGKVTQVVGKVINPTLSMIGHSCYPNATRVCFENKTVVVAQRAIRPGEAISLSYTVPFYAATRPARQSFLYSSYILVCECDACKGDWPLFDSLPGLAFDSAQEANGQMTNGHVNSFYSSKVTKVERGVLEEFQKVKQKIEDLHRLHSEGSLPNKMLIQNQIRLFRCLLVMYSSKLHIVKTANGTLPVSL